MSNSRYQIAELNIGRVLAPVDDPLMKEFVDALDAINALAERSRGFVWRLKDEESGNATSISVPGEPDVIVNLSVWETPGDLRNYVYQGDHASFLKRRKEWFSLMEKPYLVLWWVEHGHRPDVDEALDRLDHLRRYGNTPYAFNINGQFSGQDASEYTPRERDRN